MTRGPETTPPAGPHLSFLRGLGYAELTHDSHVPFLSHLMRTRRLLLGWGERPALCDAGLFHSVYGTEYFRPDAPVGRSSVRELIGPEAEAIAWTWCSVRRETLDVTEPWAAVDRRSGEHLALGRRMLNDLATLWAADTVEQIERMAADERGFAQGLERVLPFASLNARTAAHATLGVTDGS